VLSRVCRITCTRPHTCPQLDEGHDAFVAVERADANCWCHICRHGLEKALYSYPSGYSDFPSSVADVDVKGLHDDDTFNCPVWRDGECLRGAGGGEGMGEAEAAAGCRCVCLCLTLCCCS
jgi:hypothetical protein